MIRTVSRKRRRAVAAVELAIVLPILILALVGIIEFGRAVMVQQIITNAAREGARRAILPGAKTTSVLTLVETYLDNTSVHGAGGRVVQVQDARRRGVSGRKRTYEVANCGVCERSLQRSQLWIRYLVRWNDAIGTRDHAQGMTKACGV